MKCKFNDTILDVDKLSVGCKTVLNVLYNPDNVFCLKECGNNALEVLYALDEGNVYSDYALIPFEMDAVNVHTSFVVDFKFKNNITILTGDSGTGKTASYSFIKECMALNSDILCLNYLDYQKNIGEIIRNAEKN